MNKIYKMMTIFTIFYSLFFCALYIQYLRIDYHKTMTKNLEFEERVDYYKKLHFM